MVNIRCLFNGHQWKYERETKIYRNEGDTMPLYSRYTYICQRCLKSKKVEL